MPATYDSLVKEFVRTSPGARPAVLFALALALATSACSSSGGGDASSDAGAGGHADSAASAPLGCDAGGPCPTTCQIGGSTYTGGTPDPGNPCQGCSPAINATSWSHYAAGTSCGDGGMCAANSCVYGCTIQGVAVDIGSANPSNPCEACDPAQSVSAWSPIADKTSCGSDSYTVCCSGACINLENDSSNCGVCGNVCADALPMCVAGLCAP